ncbi:hypothetical protein [Planomicrobium okeanokoites]|uniref:hypothetical protein n=1 Tax=Planomicrobium okeanokoites TaxID=244 RepID=UPI0024922E77|nr:hypothetical protein [Planomicrobium okeanokoites]
MIEKVEKIAALINSRSTGWFRLKPDLVNILGTENCEKLIDDFESQLGSFPSKNLPHYSLVFYLALVILHPHNDLAKLSSDIKDKESYRMMQAGLRIFLTSKSDKLKYDVELTAEQFPNKYEYINFFSGHIPDYEMDMRGFLLLFELIYYEDKQRFLNVMNQDHQNMIFLCVLLNGRVILSSNELISFLNSEDLLKANGAFFCIMEGFSNLARKISNHPTEENEEELHQKIIKIHELLEKVSEERKIHFIVNYILAEQSYPSFFADELKSSRLNTVVAELESKNLNNLYKLKDMFKVMKILPETEIERVFALHFIKWVKDDSNPYLWENFKHDIKYAISLLSDKTKKDIMQQLKVFGETLNVSSFDYQVRQSLFRKEEAKSIIIKECLGY